MKLKEIILKHSVKEIIEKQLEGVIDWQCPVLITVDNQSLTSKQEKDLVENLVIILESLKISTFLFPIFIKTTIQRYHYHYDFITTLSDLPPCYQESEESKDQESATRLDIYQQKIKQHDLYQLEKELHQFGKYHREIVQLGRWEGFLKEILIEET